MQKKNTKNTMSNSKNYIKNIGYYLPLIFIIVIIPLITYGKIVKLPIDEANFWKGGSTHVDFFSYYKSIALIVATVAFFLSYFGLFLNNKLQLQKEKRYYIPLATYIIMSIFSTIMSQNKHVAVVGFIEMYQGIFVLICYIVLTFILINYTRNERDVRIIMNSFVVLIAIEGLLGIGEYFGIEFFQSSLGKWLITPSELREATIIFSSDKYTIFGTLYNSNFVGSFCTLVLPLAVVLYLIADDKIKSIIFGLIAFLAFSIWLGCNSRAGYLGVMVSSVNGVILFRKLIKEKISKIILLIFGFILITVIFNKASDGRVSSQLTRLNPGAEIEKIENIQKQEKIRFKEVSVKENTFTVITSKETLTGIVENSKLSFIDEDGIELNTKTDEDGNITIIDKKYEGYSFSILSNSQLKINANFYDRTWSLYKSLDEYNIKVISFNNKLTEPIEALRLKFFDGKETFASNRGYIWSRTIPMLKDVILIGYGPDNYPMVFPQEDYVGRFNVGTNGMTSIVVDKPHNMYLQTAINTGVVSLIALMFIWGTYLIDSYKLYIKGNMISYVEYIGASVFLSIIAYLVAGIFNDSIISVAPLFWVLLGTGIGINIMTKERTR
ncbi:MAG: O-antigen ligase family protein [Sedimentibacter sp.]|uniref:O-antigen ligase family protein n=1 Tax=Sedimentibacter sp. TaxID=1960295 RepID=UPI0029821D34|nr:O-antigen ligase family protein [Sedimentibacter sp.]MDW5299408.1 O-antigen ligase family protein [Sedimentibacter sp.]